MPAIALGAVLSHLALYVCQTWLAAGTRPIASYLCYLLATTGATLSLVGALGHARHPTAPARRWLIGIPLVLLIAWIAALPTLSIDAYSYAVDAAMLRDGRSPYEHPVKEVAGTPLGVLDAQCWARDPEEVGKKEKRHQLPIEEKESVKWLRSYRAVAEAQRLCANTIFVSVGDRESDIFELFDEATRTSNGPKLLVRAERTRNRKTLDNPGSENHEYLWERMKKQPVVGHRSVHIPKKSTRPGRTAKIEVRYASVLLRPPVDSKLQPVQVWAVYAREVGNGPEVNEPIEWMLLTTVAVSSSDDAEERLRWYTLRWGIELFHRILKSGCRIEDRLLDDADSLKKCLALDLVVAWRIHQLMKASRETPDVPCTGFFEDDEWKVLHAFLHNEPPPSTTPSLQIAVHMMSRLGGFIARKRSTQPGMITLWRGLIRLNAMVSGARAALRHIAHHAGAPP